MKRKLACMIVVGTAVVSPLVMAADGGVQWSGEASVGLRGTNTNALDPSKSREYRDTHSSALGIFDVKGRGDDYYVNAFGENLGRDDQYLDLKGGKYGIFKYQLYGNELRHNFGAGAGALSPYAGIGTANLTAVTTKAGGITNTIPANWNSFDNSYKRQDIGGMFEFSNNSPWYIRADVNEVRRDGVKLISGAIGTSPGQGFMDLPSPVDFKTTNFSLEGGYTTKRGQVAVSWLQSKFTNANPYLNWTNGYLGGGSAIQDTTVLPPNNDFTKFGLNGTLRQLPAGSTLAGRLSYSKVTDDVPVLQNILSLVGAGVGVSTNVATAANRTLFQGNVVNKTASLSLTSHPLAALDTRVYWNWFRKDNNSTAVTFNPVAAPAAANLSLSGGGGTVCSATAPCTNDLFNYRKDNVGIEGGYRINRQNKISAGFDYFGTNRERPDSNKTNDRKYYTEWKSSPFDILDTRIKYQYLSRSSNYLGGDPLVPLDKFVRRFDLSNVKQNLLKVTFDVSPAPFLDFGFEGIYKNNDFNETPLGRQKDNRQEYYASVSYGDPKTFRMMLFGDIELTQYDSLHRVGACNPDPQAPAQGPTPACLISPGGGVSSTYTWSAKNLDRSYQAGLGADWLPGEKWILKSSLIWAKTQGSADFAAQSGTVLSAPFLPIQNFDNTTRVSLNLKGTYKYSRNWNFTGGYAFERYRFSDIGYDNFLYTVTPAVSATCTGGGARCASFLSGQSAYQNYNANVFYLIGTYKF